MSHFFKYFRLFMQISIAGAVLVLGSAAWYYYAEIKPSLPDVASIKKIDLSVPLRIYTADGKLMSEVGATRRYLLSYEEIPQHLKDALLVAEDKRFFEHFGVDLRGLTRAVVALVRTGKKSQGASTLTMQLARNYFLSREKSYLRKVREIAIALRLEQLLTKEEILTLYMNKIFLGYRSYGFETAAQTYYGKSAKELTIAEAAMLAGLPKAPSAYNPIINPSRAKQRRNHILKLLLNEGRIDKREHDKALTTSVHASLHGADIEVDAGHAAEMARIKAREILGEDAYIGGYKLFTTISSTRQSAAATVVQKQLLNYNRRQPYPGPAKIFSFGNTGDWDEQLLKQAIQTVKRVEHLKRAVIVDNSENGVALAIEGNQIAMLRLPKESVDWALSADLSTYPAVESLVEGEALPGVVDEPQYTTVTVVLGQASTLIAVVSTDGTHVELVSTLVNVVEYQRQLIEKESNEVSIEHVLPIGSVIYLEQNEGQYRLNTAPIAQAALVSMRVQNGKIDALIGGYSFRDYKYNRAVQANRQPGSIFKPFVYTAALARGYSAAHVINDAPVTFENSVTGSLWQPSNYSGRHYGPTRLREGLIKSRNVVSVRLMNQVGVRYTIDFLEKFGYKNSTFREHNDLSIALGSVPMSPLDITLGYAVFANGGYQIEPYLVARIEDSEGNSVYEYKGLEVCTLCAEGTQGVAKRVLDEDVMYIMRDIMHDVIQVGTGRKARSLRRKDLAGKTGTTNNQVDAWFAGFNSQTIATVWVGKDLPAPLGNKETGSRVALPIWIDYMRSALQDEAEILPAKPSNIVSAQINKKNGLLAGQGIRSKDVTFEIFRSTNLPQQEVRQLEPAIDVPQSEEEAQSLRRKLF